MYTICKIDNQQGPTGTGNYTQNFVITYKGKESEKGSLSLSLSLYIYIYIFFLNLNYLAVHLKLTQHCKSTLLQLKKNCIKFFKNLKIKKNIKAWLL